MLIYKAYRYELDPNNQQRTSLHQHAGIARFTYNWGLAQRIKLFKENKGNDRFTDAMKQHKQLTSLKKTEFTWMSSGGVLLIGISRRWAAHEVKVPGGPRINGAKV